MKGLHALPVAVLAACLWVALCAPPLGAEDQPEDPVEKVKPELGAGAEAGGEGAEEESTGGQGLDLIRDTLLRDIETASYYELVAWCRSLGLSDAGTRQALEKRLVEHFRLDTVRREAAGEERRVVEIRSATETEYFTIEEASEDYVVLKGDVLVELREENAVHRIRAERILLNQSAGLLTAEGGIEYTLLKGEEEEVFHGEKLTFDIEDWGGMFFRGGLEADRDISGKSVRFRFEGERITRLPDDTVVMDRGTISSCEDRETPHYQVRARKIWVLAPGEWAILSAVLYVGRVPLAYLPFYFHPGDEFFFHPAIGIRDREGYYLQTTTYLVGQKAARASALSFLAATEESTIQYRKRIRGLFLRPVEGETVEKRDDRFLKILIDAYSRLGVFAGVSGSFPPGVSFTGGVGFSRNVYEVGGAYLPFTEVSGEYRSVWNWSRLFGALVPFRYGLDTSWSLNRGKYSLSGKLEHYSDALFLGEFFDRSEDIGLTRLAGLEEGTTASVATGEKQSLSWELRSSADFSGISKSPLLKTLSVPYLNANLVWSLLVDQSPEVEAADSRFYAPTSLRIPTASVQISGELLNLPGTRRQDLPRQSPPEAPDWADELRVPAAMRAGGASAGTGGTTPGTGGIGADPAGADPAGEPGTGTGPGPGATRALRPPSAKPDLATSLAAIPLSMNVSYQVRPNVKVEQTFDSGSWTTAADVGGDLRYTSVDTYGTTSLDYRLRVLEDLLAVNGSLLFAGNYRKSFDQGYGDDTGWANLVLGDYQYSQLNLRNTFNATSYPLRGVGTFGKSSLSYSLAWTVFRYSLAGTVGLEPVFGAAGPEWSAGGVSQHAFKGELSWHAFERDNALSLSMQLWPRDVEFTANAAFQLWMLRSTINTVLREPDRDDPLPSGWELEIPVVIQERVEIMPEVAVLQELRLDAVPGIVTRSSTSVNLWGFSAAFTADRESLGSPTWGPMEPALVSASYKLPEQSLYLWKNRIRLQTSLSSSWSMNLRDLIREEYPRNSLDFSFNFKMFVHEFMELSFSSVSYNNRTYLYFPGAAEKLGYSWVNPLTDLLRSFNFASEADRLASAFKLKSINVSLVHHLHDWDLTLRYSGMPELSYRVPTGAPSGEAAKYRYEWNSSFSIYLQWIPIPELRSTVGGEKLGEDPWDLTLRGEQE